MPSGKWPVRLGDRPESGVLRMGKWLTRKENPGHSPPANACAWGNCPRSPALPRGEPQFDVRLTLGAAEIVAAAPSVRRTSNFETLSAAGGARPRGH